VTGDKTAGEGLTGANDWGGEKNCPLEKNVLVFQILEMVS
jgi:hypothetical protein